MRILELMFLGFLVLSVVILITGPIIYYLSFFENTGRLKVRALTPAESKFFRAVVITQTLTFVIGTFTQIGNIILQDKPIALTKFFGETSRRLQGDWAPGGLAYSLTMETTNGIGSVRGSQTAVASYRNDCKQNEKIYTFTAQNVNIKSLGTKTEFPISITAHPGILNHMGNIKPGATYNGFLTIESRNCVYGRWRFDPKESPPTTEEFDLFLHD